MAVVVAVLVEVVVCAGGSFNILELLRFLLVVFDGGGCGFDFVVVVVILDLIL